MMSSSQSKLRKMQSSDATGSSLKLKSTKQQGPEDNAPQLRIPILEVTDYQQEDAKNLVQLKGRLNAKQATGDAGANKKKSAGQKQTSVKKVKALLANQGKAK